MLELETTLIRDGEGTFYMSLNDSLIGGVHAEFSKVDEYTIPLSDSLSLRIYSDTKPFNGDIADLQKGLILVYKGVETVGEGTGFGTPAPILELNLRICNFYPLSLFI